MTSSNGKFTVLYVAPRFHTNQTAAVRAWIKAGDRVYFDVFTAGRSEDYSHLTPHIIPLSIFSRGLRRLTGIAKAKAGGYRRKMLFTFPSPLAYFRRIKKINPDLIIVREPENCTFSLIAALCARWQRRQLVVYRQVIPENYFQCRRLRVLRFITAAVWITPIRSVHSQKECRSKNKVWYIPFPVLIPPSPTRLNTRQKGDKQTVNIICVGKFQKRKNHCLLIKAVLNVRRKYEATLTIIGEMSDEEPEHKEVMRQIRQLLHDRQAENRVTVKTNLPHEEVMAEYFEHDLFVLPSSREPASFSQLEAMAAGLPVVCSDDNGAACYVEENMNGFIFNAGNEDDLTAKIKKAIMSPAKLQQMGKQSARLAQSVHAPDKYRQTILKACGYDIAKTS